MWEQGKKSKSMRKKYWSKTFFFKISKAKWNNLLFHWPCIPRLKKCKIINKQNYVSPLNYSCWLCIKEHVWSIREKKQLMYIPLLLQDSFIFPPITVCQTESDELGSEALFTDMYCTSCSLFPSGRLTHVVLTTLLWPKDHRFLALLEIILIWKKQLIKNDPSRVF